MIIFKDQISFEILLYLDQNYSPTERVFQSGTLDSLKVMGFVEFEFLSTLKLHTREKQILKL